VACFFSFSFLYFFSPSPSFRAPLFTKGGKEGLNGFGLSIARERERERESESEKTVLDRGSDRAPSSRIEAEGCGECVFQKVAGWGKMGFKDGQLVKRREMILAEGGGWI
jgi:hypothetical protein